MREKILAILKTPLVQWLLGGGLLTLLADALDVFHTEPVLAVAAAASCDASTIGGAIAKLFGLC